MHNLRFWSNAVGLIEFSETYHGYFDPRNALEEYMFVALVERVVRNVSSQGYELS
jgi:hypothetical protein